MPNTPYPLIANGTIRVSRFIKMDVTAPFKCLESDANNKVIGISQVGTNFAPLSDLVTTHNAATQGQKIQYFGDGDSCQVECGDTITAGDYLKSDADGKAVSIATSGTTLQRYGAWALQDGVSGELIQVQVLIGSERPALT